MKLSVIMPVYNEKATIDEIIKKVRDVECEKELVIVDDFSNDGTREILKRYEQDGGDIKVLYHDRNMGKGGAVKTALSQISGELVIVQDGDLEYDPKYFTDMKKVIEKGECDAVFGSRIKLRTKRSYFMASVGNWVITKFANLLAMSHLEDLETCYKMIKTDILKSMNLKSWKFDIDAEITMKLLKNKKYKIKEVPISYDPRSYAEGKKIGWQDGVQAIYVLLKYRFFD